MQTVPLSAVNLSLRRAAVSRSARLMVSAATTAGSPLITPVKFGSGTLKHRVVLSPMTRLRCDPGTEAPNDLVALYYGQRSSDGGLVLSECAAVSAAARGYARAPGFFRPEQVEGWKKVAKAAHDKGAVFFAQLFHPGRISHSSMLPGGQPTISASPVAAAGTLYVDGGVKKPYEVPKEATLDDIKQVVKDFADSAVAAVKEVGADGVEIHAGNGYLLQQFLALKTNQRTDAYGGSVENRARLLLEVIDAVAAAVGPERVGVKLQPGVTFSDLIEPEDDVKAQLAYLGPELSKRGLAYVCLSSLNSPPYSTNLGLAQANVSEDIFKYFRPLYTGTLMINGGLGIEQGEAYVADGTAELVSYGVPFIANANLPALIAAGKRTADLNPGGWTASVWYSKDPAKDVVGYTDWPLEQP